MNLRISGTLIAAAITLLPMVASALTTTVGIGAFSGAETVLTFDGIAEDQIVMTEFLSQGVDFSANGSDVSGSTAAGSSNEAWSLFSAPGTSVLQNFMTACATSAGCPPMIIDFVTPQELIGFDLITGPGIAKFEIVSQGSSTTFNLASGFPESFFGFHDPAGIERITITAPTNSTGAIGINDLRFEQPVPEPSAALVFGIGCLIVGGTTRRGQRR